MAARTMEKIALLPSASFRLDGGAMFGIVPKTLWSGQYPPDRENRVLLTTRTVYVEDEKRRILIDPGMGLNWEDRLRERYSVSAPGISIEESLNRMGASSESITDVVLTHLHFDHLGGCFTGAVSKPELCFPGARHWVQNRHWEWANHPSERDRASFDPIHLEALRSSNRVELVEGEAAISGAVHCFPVDGHTRAQQLIWMECGERRFLYGGDLFPLAASLRPNWIMSYDLEPLETLESKTVVGRRFFDGRTFLILGHDPVTAGGFPTHSSRGFELEKPLPAPSEPVSLYGADGGRLS